MTVTEDDIERALNRHGDFLMTLPNVVGVGSSPLPGTDEPAIAVYVSSPPLPQQTSEAPVPASLDVEGPDGQKAVKTHLITVGLISPQSLD